jgi:hypothetical protein
MLGFFIGCVAMAQQVNALKRLSFMYRIGIERENNHLKSELKLFIGHDEEQAARRIKTPQNRVIQNLLKLQAMVRHNGDSFDIVNKVLLDVTASMNTSMQRPLMKEQLSEGYYDVDEKAYLLRITESFRTIREDEGPAKHSLRNLNILDEENNPLSPAGALVYATGGGVGGGKGGAARVDEHGREIRGVAGRKRVGSVGSSGGSWGSDEGGGAGGGEGAVRHPSLKPAWTAELGDDGPHACDMEGFGDWNFDILQLHERTGGLSLQMVASRAVLSLDLLPELRLRQSTFYRFIEAVASGYERHNPYHNASHAADVVNSLYHLLVVCDMRGLRHCSSSNGLSSSTPLPSSRGVGGSVGSNNAAGPRRLPSGRSMGTGAGSRGSRGSQGSREGSGHRRGASSPPALMSKGLNGTPMTGDRPRSNSSGGVCVDGVDGMSGVDGSLSLSNTSSGDSVSRARFAARPTSATAHKSIKRGRGSSARSTKSGGEGGARSARSSVGSGGTCERVFEFPEDGATLSKLQVGHKRHIRSTQYRGGGCSQFITRGLFMLKMVIFTMLIMLEYELTSLHLNPGTCDSLSR